MARDGEATRPPTRPLRRRRWLRRLGWGVGLLLVVLLLAPLALRIGAVRGWIAERIGTALDRRVEIGATSGYWFRGVDLEDVVVHSPEGFDGPLAQVSKIHADVDLLSLLGGAVHAHVRVVMPHVTLRRDATGRSNAKDLGGRAEVAPEAPPPGTSTDEAHAPLDLRLVLMGGSVEALDASGSAENALHDIQLTAEIKPDGRRNVDLQANARGAGTDGADARIAGLLAMDAEGTGLFKIDVPPLQLERLARLAEDTLDVAELTGSVQLEGEGTLHPDETVSGTLQAQLVSVAARSPDGTRVSVRRLVADAHLRSVSQSTEAEVGLTAGDLRVERRVAGRDASFREPDITARATGRWNAREKRLRIAEGGIQGGSLAQVVLPEALRIEMRDALRFEGRVDVDVDLGRLGALGGVLPALEPLAGGTLQANVEGSGGSGLDLGVGLLIRDLALRPSELAPEGYAEPRIVAAFRLRRENPQDPHVVLTQLQSQLLTFQPARTQRGLEVTLSENGAYAVDGEFALRIELEALGRLLGSRMRLGAGEHLGGRLRIAGNGRGSPQDMRLTGRVRGEDVRVPPSWSRVATPASFDAQFLVTRKGDDTQLTMSELQGMGLAGTAGARLHRVAGPDGRPLTQLRDLEAQLTIDLASARPWLGGLMGLDTRASLGGRVRTDVRVVTEPGGHRLVGTTQANELMVQLRPDAQALREARVTVRSDVHLAEPGGRHEARELKLDASGLQLDLSGSTLVEEPEADADLRATLGGDAARLAPTLAALLGPGYEDLRGDGKLAGTLRLTGSGAAHGAALFPQADLVLGSWSTAGLRMEKILLRAERADSAAPLALTLQAGVNGGRADVQGQVRLGSDKLPWTAEVRMQDVDTSTLLTSRGAGRYLAFALPALLPADAPTQVLSGRLDAELRGAAPALQGPTLGDGLKGRGTLTMQQGEIKQSTLFGGGTDGSFGKLVSALRVAVPEAGAVLSEVSQAVTFERLESVFDVASRVVTIRSTRLQGRRVVVDASGTVGFDERLDLQAKMALQGAAGEKLGKVVPGGIIPLRVKGTLEQPAVQPQLDPAKLVGLSGGKGSLLDRIKDKLPDLPKPPKLPDLPKPPKLPKLPNPFK